MHIIFCLTGTVHYKHNIHYLFVCCKILNIFLAYKREYIIYTSDLPIYVYILYISIINGIADRAYIYIHICK